MKIITRSEAKNLKLLRYFTGEPCLHGHIAERLLYHKGKCADCVKIRRKKQIRERPEIKRAQRKRHKLKRRGVIGSHTAQEIIDMLKKQKRRCAICSVPFSEIGYHVDHIHPLSRGGSNFIRNIQLLCPPCNIKKSDKIHVLLPAG